MQLSVSEEQQDEMRHAHFDGAPGVLVSGLVWLSAALNQLGMASTIWLILCCGMAYGLFLFKPVLFFPAMMVTIGSRYLVFASMFGRSIFWVMGVSLIVAGNVALFAAIPPVVAAAVGGLIEVLFAGVVFSKAARPAIVQ